MRWYFPLFTLAFALAAAVQLWAALPGGMLPVLCGACMTGAVICFLLRRRKASRYVCALLLGGVLGLTYTAAYAALIHAPLDALAGSGKTLHATVTGYADRYENSQRVPLRVDVRASGLNLWMRSFSTTAYVPLTEEELTPGDAVQGWFTFYRGTANGGFDRAAYYAGRNDHILASCKEPVYFKVTKPARVPLSLRPQIWAEQCKTRMKSFLDARSASLSAALVFGDRDALSTHDRQSLQKAGLSHVTAVSGMHVGFLVSFFLLVFGRRIGMVLALAALAVFVPMAGASPSVIRAAIMYAFAAGGFFLRQEISPLHSLCAALMILLLWNPYALGSLSLQLSFLATLGLIAFAGRVQRALLHPFQEKLRGVLGKVIRLAACAVGCSVGAFAFTTPVLFASFGYVSAASFLANLLTIGVFAVLFMLNLLLCLLGTLPIIGTVLAAAVHGLSAYVFRISDMTGRWTALLLYWDVWFVKAGVLAVYLLFAACLLGGKRFCCAPVLACCVFVLMLYSNAQMLDRRHETTLLSCGSGQAITVAAGQDCLAVIDCAGSGYQNAVDAVEEYMDWYGFEKIDLLVLTALDKTHARNVPQLLREIPVCQLVLPDGTKNSELAEQVMQTAQEQGAAVTVWHAGGERMAGMRKLGISLLGGMPGKLGVRVRCGTVNLLTLHSFAPGMVKTLLEDPPEPCTQLVVSDKMAETSETLAAFTKQGKTKELLLSTGWTESGRRAGLPLRTTRTEGDIRFDEVVGEGEAG